MSTLELVQIKCMVGWQQSKAYVSELWIGTLTTLAYSLTYILLLDFIFARVTTIAGYTRPEMYFIFFIGQLAFFFIGFWSYEGNQGMIRQVNTGNLDFTLLRPVSPLWNLATERVRVVDGLVRLAFILPLYSLVVDWSELTITLRGFVIGVIILFIGLFAEHVLHFLMSVTVFWFGEAQNLQYLIFGLTTQRIPYEAMPGWFKLIFTAIIPTYITSSVVASAMLEKTNPWRLLILVALVGAVFYSLKMIAWKAALKQYSSASS